MPRPKLAFVLSQVLVAVLFMYQLGLSSATCTGSDPCHACKNCKYCRFCAKLGGKCGVCK